MEIFLPRYEVNQPTWFYLSLLLIVAVFFRFNRVFSLRNFDLLLLLSASPGLIFVNSDAGPVRLAGHVWLYVVACLFLLRLFMDSFFNRRPYLGQNLNVQGLGFLCCAAFAFLMTQAISQALPAGTQDAVQQANDMLTRTATDTPAGEDQMVAVGPAPAVLAAPAQLVFQDLAPRIVAILAHAAVIIGLWFVGRNLFADKSLGLAMATLYLLLPCTAFNVGEYVHVLPAALMVWAFVCYRQPVVSGILLGLACGTMLFPVFLLPIWAAFYGRKRAGRFAAALAGVAVALVSTFALTSSDVLGFMEKTLGTIDVALAQFSSLQLTNSPNSTQYFWGNLGILSVYRLPVMVAYFVMVAIMTIWPRFRTVEVLLAQSAAALVGTQLWYTQRGGVYLLWYLPLILMVVFRPRLLHLRPLEPAEAASEGNRAAGGNSLSGSIAAPRLSPVRNIQLF